MVSYSSSLSSCSGLGARRSGLWSGLTGEPSVPGEGPVDARRPTLEGASSPTVIAKSGAQLFAKVAGDAAFRSGNVRITPFVRFEGMLRAECNTVAAPFAPSGIKTYVGTGFFGFSRLIFSCGHVSLFLTVS